MPKQVFQNGILSIQLDPNDPHDTNEIQKQKSKGKSISAMTTKEMRDLLTALNDIHNLGLKT